MNWDCKYYNVSSIVRNCLFFSFFNVVCSYKSVHNWFTNLYELNWDHEIIFKNNLCAAGYWSLEFERGWPVFARWKNLFIITQENENHQD